MIVGSWFFGPDHIFDPEKERLWVQQWRARKITNIFLDLIGHQRPGGDK
jgi:hypothetical protein